MIITATGRMTNNINQNSSRKGLNISKKVKIKSDTVALFCYGTLNIHDVQRRLWGESKSGKPFVLNDHELKMYDNNIFYVVRKMGEQVSGKVYNLSKEQIEATDWYEGGAYERAVIMQDKEAISTYIQAKGIFE